MKIAVLAEFFFPAIGGQEQRLLEILKLMSKQGHEVDVYTIRYLSELTFQEEYNGINIYRIYDDFEYRSGGGLKSRSVKTIVGYSLRVVSILRSKNYDKLIYTQFPIFHIMLSKLLVNSNKKILDFVEFRESKFWRLLFGIEARCADKVVCISKSVCQKCGRIADQSKLTVIPSSIELGKFKNNETKKYFVFVGRIEPHKHPEDAIRAVLEYNEKFNTDYSLHLIGDGTLLNALKAKYGKEESIIFHGFITEAEKIQILKKALVLVFPSEREGLPVSVVEGMAAGVPTVTTNYPDNGTKDFVKDYGIGVVTPPVISGIAEGIFEVMQRIDYYRQCCATGIEDFCSEKAAEKFLNV